MAYANNNKSICLRILHRDRPVMAIGATTVGPIREETRDRLKSIRDEEGYGSYEETLTALAEAYEVEDGI